MFGENEYIGFPKKNNNRRTISIVTERYTPLADSGNSRDVAASAIRDAVSEVSLDLYKSQSQTERLLICSQQSYMLNFRYFSCKERRPLPD